MSDSEVPADPRQNRWSGWLSAGNGGMPPWVPRLLVQIGTMILLGIFLYGVVRALRSFLVLLLISLFLSTAFEPGVAYLARRGWRRGLATGVLFLLVFVVGGGFVASMIPLLVDQTVLLVERIPSYLEQLESFAADLGVDFSADRLAEAFATIEGSLEQLATDLAGRALGVGSRLVGSLFQLLTIGLFTFYITADGPRLRRTVLSILPPPQQLEVLRILDIAIDKTGGYFYSRALLAGVATLVTWTVFRIIGIPFALPLSMWVGVLSQFVPVVGTYIGGILPVLIGLLESPGRALGVLVFILVYQQFENYVIGPRITARTMQLHPAVAFGSAIVGATLLGVPGALMALPTAATIQAFVSTYLERHQVVASPLLEERKPNGPEPA